jgi:chorismate mutase
MTVRGVRGATIAAANTREAILAATHELLSALVQANDLREPDIASVFFTVTPDLNAAFPARAARDQGWMDVALLDAQAPAVDGDLPRCVRVLIHWNTELTPAELKHVYLHEARKLRPDLAAEVKQ